MEGSQKRGLLRRSLRAQLTVVVCLISLITGICGGVYTFMTVRSETERFIDDELGQIAAIVINYDMLIPKRWEGPRHLHERAFMLGLRRQGMGMGRGMQLHMREAQRSAETAEEQVLPSLSDISRRGYDIVIAPLIGRAGDAVFIPLSVADGYYTVLMSDERVRVRVASKLNGQRFVVARPLDPIEEISADALRISLVEFLLLFIFYMTAAVTAVNVLFKRINLVASVIKQRSEEDLSPISEKSMGRPLPSELDAFVEALNGMFGRIEDNMRVKQRFIADAAHEMRTPLTALSLQAENLLSEKLSPELALKVKTLQQGIRREQQLMNSLLTLARLQNKTEPARAPVSVQEVFIELLEELGPIADEKDIDFGLASECSYTLKLPRMEFKTVMYNFAANALKYTKAGGQVDLGCSYDPASGVFVSFVQDNGPGIDPAALTLIFEPFFRVKGDREKEQGTGLGLAIAKAAAERMGAQLTLVNREQGGLRAELCCVLKSKQTD